jgi:hypothetical protein
LNITVQYATYKTGVQLIISKIGACKRHSDQDRASPIGRLVGGGRVPSKGNKQVGKAAARFR